MSLVGIPFSQYFKVHQYVTVPANTLDYRVFYGKIPNSKVGFIYKVGNNYHSGSTLRWRIDGADVEREIERQIGSIDSPAPFNMENGGPYLVRDYVEFTATNNNSEDLIFEVLVDGLVYERR